MEVAAGDRAIFVEDKWNKEHPQYYPKTGTVGVVLRISGKRKDAYVQWPQGSTSMSDRWWATQNTLMYLMTLPDWFFEN